MYWPVLVEEIPFLLVDNSVERGLVAIVTWNLKYCVRFVVLADKISDIPCRFLFHCIEIEVITRSS